MLYIQKKEKLPFLTTWGLLFGNRRGY